MCSASSLIAVASPVRGRRVDVVEPATHAKRAGPIRFAPYRQLASQLRRYCGLHCALYRSIVSCVAVSLAPTFANLAHAEPNLAALHKMAQAAHQLTYEGIFVSSSAERMETSRVAHGFIDGQEVEHMEVLDGSPREMIRRGDETSSFFSREKRLIIETGVRQRQFPSLLFNGLRQLSDHYTVRYVGQGRVAGLDSRVIELVPRDALRYGHQFWLDEASGLLLRTTILNSEGETLDSFSFTQLKIGSPLSRQAFKPKFPSEGLSVQKIVVTEAAPEHLGWAFQKKLPGFRRVHVMRRESDTEPPSLHVLFSDGVATISTFIEAAYDDAARDAPQNAAQNAPQGATKEPARPQPAKARNEREDTGTVRPSSIARMGALNVYHREVHGHMVVVMGEVPVLALKQFGDGIVWNDQ